ncbi:hypothetical protein B0H34DRAFT_703355, partial [Crassisporium funariophilum]
MANYLPVLLVSVSTNAVPDDSSLTTLPRGQVDYLSHDWQEEDVWRSWRNMTRQKNEIANGMRLENASWRTWWKQRNKLKTVTPETLNWLKDSDVTWLYGPLHTAVEWTPPPKPQPVPDSVDTDPASAHDRLDLSSSTRTLRPPQHQPHKPILKHRSISELLTSDLFPTSPIFSPVESEDEQDDPSILHSHPLTAHPRHKRPTLTHTKSDTHITRWGPSRAFRKDSPPRIDPPGFDGTSQTFHAQPSYLAHLHLPPQPSAEGPIRASLSQDSNSSGSGGAGTAGGVSGAGERTKKKHISFNTFVEQCIAIEKPKPKKSLSGFFSGVHGDEAGWVGGSRGVYVDDDGYEEDQEDSEGEEEMELQQGPAKHPVMVHAVRNDSDSPSPYEEDEEEEGDADDDGVIEMRSSSRRNTNTPKKLKPPPRSQSKVSTASSSSSASTSTSTTSTTTSTNSSSSRTTSSPGGSLSPSRLHRKPSSSSSTSTSTSTATTRNAYRPPNPYSTYTQRRGGPPPLIRTPSEHHHVTIAPIAPTILKTTGAWSEGFGDEGASDDGLAGWVWANGVGGLERKGKGRSAPYTGTGSMNGGGTSAGMGGYGSFGMGGGGGEEGHGSDGTPVELVYVPPFGSNYSLGTGEYEYEYEGAAGYDGYGHGHGHGHHAYGVYDEDVEEEEEEEEEE